MADDQDLKDWLARAYHRELTEREKTALRGLLSQDPSPARGDEVRKQVADIIAERFPASQQAAS